MRRVQLLEDIYSSSKKDKLYGLKGAPVDVIAKHGHVLLVKDIKGNTFPVQQHKTTFSHEN